MYLRIRYTPVYIMLLVPADTTAVVVKVKRPSLSNNNNINGKKNGNTSNRFRFGTLVLATNSNVHRSFSIQKKLHLMKHSTIA